MKVYYFSKIRKYGRNLIVTKFNYSIEEKQNRLFTIYIFSFVYRKKQKNKNSIQNELNESSAKEELKNSLNRKQKNTKIYSVIASSSKNYIYNELYL